MLDIALILHMEHGGGNNSTFTTHVVTSSGTDTYSAIAAALCSLKGPKHGGANIKVVEMMRRYRRQHVRDINPTKRKSRPTLLSLLRGQGCFRPQGSDLRDGPCSLLDLRPARGRFSRALSGKLARRQRATETRTSSFTRSVEPGSRPRPSPEERRIYKGVSANVDFYSGFVYCMLDIPHELYTPIFAIARIVGWSCAPARGTDQRRKDHPSGL